MKRLLFTVPVICLLAMIFSRCHKPEGIPTQSTYTFTNTTDRRITFDIYAGKEDYNRNEHRLQQYFIGPGDVQKVAFDVARTYWIDWYSADFTRNNWRSQNDGRTMPLSEITIAASDDALAIGTSVKDTSRSILLSSNGLSSNWQGAITHADSLNGIFSFEFRKDFSGEYHFTDAQGTVTSKPITYTVFNGFSLPEPPDFKSNFRMVVSDGQPDKFCEIYANPAQDILYSGRDSMMLVFSRLSSTLFWSLVRQ